MPLKDRLYRNTEAGVWLGELPVQSRYTAGVAAERFFAAIRDTGRFIGARCAGCEEVYVPPRQYCEKCLAELKDDDQVKVGPTGTLESWTLLHVGLDGKRLPRPEVVGLVRLDGATTALVHRLGEVDACCLCVGIKVKPVLKPEKKREGAITDILYFKPA
ncbi:Zn-ribbon domain-containing OB-fold protein [candidate division WOR-3 bacterium]|nr:Zn-ribbon domain-containing OB-fold protein [candidate division WOR-3 bacterium]